jgi:DNA topoisomerase-1
VNDYIREAAGEDFTAKDFRTWAGTVHAAAMLGSVEEVGASLSARDKHVVAAIKETARALRNRPATCRKYYVHPAVIEAFRLGALPRALGIRPEVAAGEPPPCALSVLEEAVLNIIDHAAHDAAHSRAA